MAGGANHEARWRTLTANPLLYDAVQAAAGAGRLRERLGPHVASFAGTSVLDVGAGTGTYAAAIPDPARYVALDVDPQKLERLERKRPGTETVLGDASRLEFPDGSFDNALCTFLIHHLDDQQLEGLTSGLRRILRGRLVVVDPVADPSLRSRLLWSIDQGSHPRSAEALRAALAQDFTIEHEEEFRVHHRYLLCVATPKFGS